MTIPTLHSIFYKNSGRLLLLFAIYIGTGGLHASADSSLRLVLPDISTEDVVVILDSEKVEDWNGDSIPVLPGSHWVHIKKPGYATYSKKFTIEEEEQRVLTASLELNSLEVFLDVNPDTEVWLNDKHISTGPWTGRMKEGINTVMLTKPNYNQAIYTLLIEPGNQQMRVHLDDPNPILFTYNITTDPKGATIYVDGKYQGETPLTVSDLRAGTYEFKFVKEGYKTQILPLTIGQSESGEVINLKLQREH